MAYTGDGRGRTGRGRAGATQRTETSRPLVSGTSSYHGPRGTRSRPSRGGLVGSRPTQGGYALRARSIDFKGGRGRVMGVDRRFLVTAALAVVLVVLVVAGVSSCVRGCSSDQGSGSGNPVDARVAAGVSEDLTSRLAAQLDRDDKLAQIAASADSYTDQELLELALSQPSAIDFVAAYPDAPKEAQPFGASAERGTVPELYCWDARWGNVDYAGHALALTGSGPTSLAMAYIGLTGNTDRTPADFAADATEQDLTGGDSAMIASLIENEADGLGLKVSALTASADSLSEALSSGSYVMLEVAANTLTNSAHWVLLGGKDGNGDVLVFDPTSPEVTARPWSAGTLASSAAADSLYVVSLAQEGQAQ